MSEEPAYREPSAKALCLMTTTLSGTVFIYQGQEIGMINVPKEWGIDEYQDIATQQYYAEQLKRLQKAEGRPDPDMSGIMGAIRRVARDNSRTPMQWDSSPSGGFTTGKPWMKSSPDAKTCNVAAQLSDASSVLSFWKKTLVIRKAEEVLVYGSFELVEWPSAETSVFSYIRRLESKAVLVAINFTEVNIRVDIRSTVDFLGSLSFGELMIGTYEDSDLLNLGLRPFEGVMYDLRV